MQRFSANLPLERMHAARDGERIIGGAGAFPFTMTVPGARVPCAGVTVVGVYPTQRRRGALRADPGALGVRGADLHALRLRNGAGPKRFAVVERNGEPTAYAVYRHAPKFEEGASLATLRVLEAISPGPRGLAEVWRYLLDIDWTATVKGFLLPLDHPLFLLLAEPRRLRYRAGDGLWVRLVDVGAALSARTYAADDAVVFELADDFLPDNAGR